MKLSTALTISELKIVHRQMIHRFNEAEKLFGAEQKELYVFKLGIKHLEEMIDSLRSSAAGQ